ncbi:hypothetical protein NDU88_007594 [Pleurodeles waltl]|uniref:Uncharacterized protein n=1 Tax=Pleurodeles waltl TaxID=8319 RepID=A0AAV7RPW3_PLEWA|nr:hypothetical protein NDU88_007594 [Pleurodeles waltl]
MSGAPASIGVAHGDSLLRISTVRAVSRVSCSQRRAVVSGGLQQAHPFSSWGGLDCTHLSFPTDLEEAGRLGALVPEAVGALWGCGMVPGPEAALHCAD